MFRRRSTGKKLDMGKSCVRVKTLADVPLKVIGQAIKRMSTKKFIERYESVVKSAPGKRATTAGAKKTTGSKKTAATPRKKTR
jgi:hypothetical protein